MPKTKEEKKIDNPELNALTEMVEYIARALVTTPDEVSVSYELIVEDDLEKYVIRLKVDDDDKGKIIGKEGRVAQSIRSLLRVAAVKLNTRINLDIE
ncbi:MAG: KH domain-containing protein [Dehalococcoidia bacterium]